MLYATITKLARDNMPLDSQYIWHPLNMCVIDDQTLCIDYMKCEDGRFVYIKKMVTTDNTDV